MQCVVSGVSSSRSKSVFVITLSPHRARKALFLAAYTKSVQVSDARIKQTESAGPEVSGGLVCAGTDLPG